MNRQTESLPHAFDDRVGTLLLLIARRADELVKEQRHTPGLNRLCWLIAEEEVAGRLGAAAELLNSESGNRRLSHAENC
jgi:hypothetical protein